MDTGTLLAVIIVLLSMAVSLVNKVLKKAAETGVPHEGTLSDSMPVSGPDPEEKRHAPVSGPAAVPGFDHVPADRPASSAGKEVERKPAVSSEKGGFRIDKKNLVIYPEIMKPKWQE